MRAETFCGLVVSLLVYSDLSAHEGHQAATYELTPAATDVGDGPHLRIRITDENASASLAARFTLTIDGSDYVPERLDTNGLRFVSIHKRKGHVFAATYARGTGDVLVPLPKGASRGTVTVAKGFEYRTEPVPFVVRGDSATVEVRLRRWINLQQEGWHAVDEHLHYERTDPQHDDDWLTMLDADGLSHGHFLVLKGGNLPGIWADQYAYGPAGEAVRGKQFIRSGEEYRDGTQGHFNLLGIAEVIPPISTGGIGTPTIDFNYPPMHDVFRRTHELGGIGGPAHGASLARSSTAVLDTVLGSVDFFEIANSHLYKTDVWYRLLNCGFIVPPMAGTDLPNFGFRDPWQPLFGEVRTYVRTGETSGFDAWKRAVRRGEAFVTSGPLIRIKVNGVEAGGTVRLPPEGGEITIKAEIASPRPIETLEVVQMSQPIAANVTKSHRDGIHRWSIEHTVRIDQSCWLAARGTGGPKTAIEQGLNIKQNEIAHTGVVQVLVGDDPIRSEPDVAGLRDQLLMQQDYYRDNGRYERAEDRLRFVALFEKAIQELD